MRRLCGVSRVDDIKREHINHKHAELLCQFLSPKADLVLIRLFREADVNREATHLAGLDEEFSLSGFDVMTRSERILVCRIIGSQGREMEFSEDGIIVSPHRDVMKRARLSASGAA